MTRDHIMEAMNGIGEHLIVEAAEKLGFVNGSAVVVKAERRKGPSAFSRFMNSGWGVAAVCALVAVSVMGGIIWAGHQPGVNPPVVTPEETTAPFEIESENEDYIGEDQTEVMIRHGKKAIYPRKFFMWSGSADGMRFYEYVQIEQVQPILPKVYYAVDGGISPCELILPEGCKIDHVSIYGTDMMEKMFITYDGDFHYTYLLDIPVGRYYIALQMEWKSARNEYAFELEVVSTANEITDAEETEAEPQTPTFDFMASLAAIDQLASENFSVNLQYKTTTANGLKESFRGNFGQVDGKHWSYVSNEGAVVQEAEGGYYHKYVLDFSKWTYYDTYTMTDNHAFEEVYNGRYWWENYLRELHFEAYDELIYMGIEQILEKNCYMFSFDGTVEDVGHVKLGLSVDAETNNVLKMTLKIEYSGAAHVNDVVEATIEALSVKTRDEVKGPTLPDPKWDGPQDDGPIEIETPPATESTEEPETGKTEPPNVIPEWDDLSPAPLVSASDSESYVRIPYLSRGMGGMMEFFILPEGAQDTSELVSVYKIGFPEDHETNLLVVGVEKSANRYCVLFIMETSYMTELDGQEIRYVGMTCTEMVFVRDNSLSATGNTYFLMQNGGAASFQYTDQQRSSILASKRRENLNALTKAEALIESYRNATDNKYTVIYSYSDQSAEEMAMAYIPELPEISFEIFREYGFDD